MAKASVRETKQSRALKQKTDRCRKGAGRRRAGRLHPRPYFDAAAGQSEAILMKPHSVGLDEITMQNILTIDLDGNVVAGKARRHSEVYIHSEILRARTDINCVIHAHPPYCVALSSSGHPVKAYSQPGALFYEDVGVYTDTIALIRSQRHGRRRRQGARAASRRVPEKSRHRRGRQEHRGDGGLRDHAGERRDDPDDRRSRRRSGAGISARRYSQRSNGKCRRPSSSSSISTIWRGR